MTTTAAAGDGRLPLKLALAFAATSLPLQALAIAVAVHLPAYFAANLGVSLAVVGAAMGTVRLIDVPVEVGLGLAMDRTRTRLGRYRIWTLAGAPLLMLGLFMLLQADRGVGVGYLITWLLVMYLGVSILMLSPLGRGKPMTIPLMERSVTISRSLPQSFVNLLRGIVLPAVA